MSHLHGLSGNFLFCFIFKQLVWWLWWLWLLILLLMLRLASEWMKKHSNKEGGRVNNPTDDEPNQSHSCEKPAGKFCYQLSNLLYSFYPGSNYPHHTYTHMHTNMHTMHDPLLYTVVFRLLRDSSEFPLASQFASHAPSEPPNRPPCLTICKIPPDICSQDVSPFHSTGEDNRAPKTWTLGAQAG